MGLYLPYRIGLLGAYSPLGACCLLDQLAGINRRHQAHWELTGSSTISILPCRGGGPQTMLSFAVTLFIILSFVTLSLVVRFFIAPLAAQ